MGWENSMTKIWRIKKGQASKLLTLIFLCGATAGVSGCVIGETETDLVHGEYSGPRGRRVAIAGLTLVDRAKRNADSRARASEARRKRQANKRAFADMLHKKCLIGSAEALAEASKDLESRKLIKLYLPDANSDQKQDREDLMKRLGIEGIYGSGGSGGNGGGGNC